METLKHYMGVSNEEIKNTRIANAEKNAVSESRILIERLKIEYNKIQSRIENTLDLGADNTTDLCGKLKRLDFGEFFKGIYEDVDELAIIAYKIKVRTKIHNTLFPENKIEEFSTENMDLFNN